MSIYASSSTVTQQTTPRIVVDPATVQEGWILVWDESEGVFIAQPAATDDSGQLISLRGILSVEEYDSQGQVADGDSDGLWLDYDETTGIFKFYRPSLEQLGVTAAIAAITLDDLENVDVPSGGAQDGQILVWNDSSDAWEPQDLTITESDISLGLGDLLDVTLTSLQEGDILVYNGSDDFVNRPLTLDDIDFPSGGDTGDMLVLQSDGTLDFEPLVIDIADLVDQQSGVVALPSLAIDWDQIIDSTIPDLLPTPVELFDILVDGDNDSTDSAANVLQAAVSHPTKGVELGDLMDVELAGLEDTDGIAWDATAMQWVPADMSDHKHTADDILFNDVVPTTTLTGCVPNTKLNGGTAIKVNGTKVTFDGVGMVALANIPNDFDVALGSEWAVGIQTFSTPHTGTVTSSDQYVQIVATGLDIILEDADDAAEAGYEYSIVDLELNSSNQFEIQANTTVSYSVGDVIVLSNIKGLEALNKRIFEVESVVGANFTITEIGGGVPVESSELDNFGGVGFVSSKPLDLMGFEEGTHYRGQLDDALIGETSIKQHQGALEVHASQIVDLDSQFRVELDLNPQLGGALDLNSKYISGDGYINITGTISTSANFSGPLDGDVTGNLTGNIHAGSNPEFAVLTNGSTGFAKFNVVTITDAVKAEIKTFEVHGLEVGDEVSFENVTGGAAYVALNGNAYLVHSIIDDNNFTIELSLDGAAGAYEGGGIARHTKHPGGSVASSDVYQNDAVFYGSVVSPFEVDTDGNIVADADAGTYVGTLYGNVVGGVITATSINLSGEINGDIVGDVTGDLTGNILAPDGSTIVLDNGALGDEAYVNANLHGDVLADDGNFIVLQNSIDGHPDVKSGTWGGKRYNFDLGDNVGFDRQDLPLDLGYSGYDIGQAWFKGGLKAASEDIDGNWQTDIAILYPGGFGDTTNGALGTREEYLWDAWFRGQLISKNGNIVVDNGTDGSDGKFYGDVYAQDADGNTELVLDTGSFDGSTYEDNAWFKGDVLADDLTKIVENGTDGTDAEFMGDLYAQNDGGIKELIVDTGSFTGDDYNFDATYMGNVIADDGDTLILGNGTITENAINITNVTPDGDVVVQTSGDHGFTQGSVVKITGVEGTTEANGNWLVDLSKPGLGTNEFRLSSMVTDAPVAEIDWSNYVTGGIATECLYDGNATYMGDVIAEDGVTRIVDNGNDGSDAKFMGDLYAQDTGGNNSELVLHTGTFAGSAYNDDSWFKGDIKNEDGTIILDVGSDTEAAKYFGDMCGNLTGDIWAEGADPHDPADSHLKVLNNGFVNSNDEVEDAWFKGTVIGDLKGDVFAYDEDTEECFQVLESGTFTGSTYDKDSGWFLGGLRGDVYDDDFTTIVLDNGKVSGKKYDITGFTADADSVILATTGHNIEVGETVTLTGVAGTGNNLGALNGTHVVISAGLDTFEVALSDASTKVGTYVTSDPLGCVRNETVSKFVFNIEDEAGQAKFYGAHYGNIYATDGTMVGENGTNGTDAWYKGDLRNPDNTIVLNVGTDITEEAWFAGDIHGDNGEIILQREDSAGDAWLYGNVEGDQVGDMYAEDGITKVLENGTDGTDAWFMGDIKDLDGDIVVELGGGSTNTVFTGDLVGDVYNENGDLILDVDDGTGEALLCANVKGDIVSDTGEIILERENSLGEAWFYGNVDGDLTGDVMAEDGTKVFENGTDGTDATAIADILADDGTQVLENGMDGNDAWFMGDIIAPGQGDDSTPITILDTGTTDGNGNYNDDACLDAKVKGDVVAENGVPVLENGTDGTDAKFTGKVEGDLCGDVYSEDGAKILETGGGSADALLTADVFGNLTGDVHNTNGDTILDIEYVNDQSPLLVDFTEGDALYTGHVLGDLYAEDGSKAFDAETGEFDLSGTQIPLDTVFDVFVADYGDTNIHNPAEYPMDTRWGRIFDVNSSAGGSNNWTPVHGQPLGFSQNILESTSTSTSDWEAGWIPLSDIVVDSVTAPTVVAGDISTNTLVLPYLYDTNDDTTPDTLGGIYNTAGELIFNAGDADNVATYRGDLQQDNGEKVYDSITNLYTGGLLLEDTDAKFEGIVDLTEATVLGGDKFGIKYLTELEDTYEPGVLNLEVTSVIGGTSTLQQLPLYNSTAVYTQDGVITILKELNGDQIPAGDYTLEVDSNNNYTGDITFVNPRATNFIAEYQIPAGVPAVGDPLVWTDNYAGTNEGRWVPGTATNIFLADIDSIGNVDTSPYNEALVDGAYLRWDADYDDGLGGVTGKWIADNNGRNLDGLDDLDTSNMDNSDVDSNDYVDGDDKPALIFDPEGGEDSSGVWRPSAVITETNLLAATSGYEFTAGFKNRVDGFIGFENGTNVDYTYDHADNKEWMRFGFSDTNQVTVDTPYWADTTDPSSPGYVPGSTEAPGVIDGADWNNRTHTGAHEGVGAFGGAYMPGGVRSMFDFDENTDYNLGSANQTATQNGGLIYNAAQGSLLMNDLNPGDLCMFRFDFNLVPQVVNTTVEVGLIWSTRSPTNEITYTFSLTTQPLTFGPGTPQKTFLNRPLITAYIASGEDINARALPAIRSNNPVFIQPLSLLYTVIR